jgi:hypothetical protein
MSGVGSEIPPDEVKRLIARVLVRDYRIFNALRLYDKG